MQDKTREWLSRYVPLEIVATCTALIGGIGAHMFTENGVVIAFVATWGENIGYYGTAVVREALRESRAGNSTSESFFIRVVKIPRNLLFEFGVAESFDSFLVRPFCMYVGPRLVGNLAFGLVLGKIVADCFFYSVAIVFYEIRKKIFP